MIPKYHLIIRFKRINLYISIFYVKIYKVKYYIILALKTKIDLFFCVIDNNTNEDHLTSIQTIEYVRRKTLFFDKKTATINNEELIRLFKENKENGYNFDEACVYDHYTKMFNKINSNEPLDFFNNHYVNTICVFYKEKKQNKLIQKTRKINYNANHRKTKKNIQIPVKLL
jgi:hypothetical protein